MTRRALLGGSALVLGSTLLWHASSFAFNSVAARLLGPHEYGGLAALVAVLLVVTPVIVTIQTVACATTAGLAARNGLAETRPLVRLYGARVALGALAAAAALAVASGKAAGLLDLDSRVPIVLLGGALALSAVTHLQRGVIQGAARFGRYAASTVVEAAAKLAATVLLLTLVWRGVGGAVLAIAVASAVALLANHVLLRFLPAGADREPERPALGASLSTLLTLVLLAVLLASDVWAARIHLTARDAGLYAAVALTGKIVFFATSALGTVLFPAFAGRRAQGRDSRRLLGAGAAAIGAASVAVVLVLFLAPQLVLGPLFGAGFAAAGPYVGWAAVAFACYGIAYLAALYLVAQRTAAGVVVLLCSVVAQLVAFSAFHDTIWSIVGVQLAVQAVTAGALIAVAVLPRHAPLPAAEAS